MAKHRRPKRSLPGSGRLRVVLLLIQIAVQVSSHFGGR
jgi:hypothetical protein